MKRSRVFYSCHHILSLLPISAWDMSTHLAMNRNCKKSVGRSASLLLAWSITSSGDSSHTQTGHHCLFRKMSDSNLRTDVSFSARQRCVNVLFKRDTTNLRTLLERSRQHPCLSFIP